MHISAVTVSELLVGVHRANTEQRRAARSTFVEAVIAAMDVLDFTTSVARMHADLFADLKQRGQTIGAHDLIIAATARHYDLTVLTDNSSEFSRVPGLRVVTFTS